MRRHVQDDERTRAGQRDEHERLEPCEDRRTTRVYRGNENEVRQRQRARDKQTAMSRPEAQLAVTLSGVMPGTG